MIMKRSIAAFDFDGTLTTRDSFLAFIRYACGKWRYYAGFALYAPMLLLMLARLYPHDRAKQRLFSHFFKGWQHDRFAALAREFSTEIDKMRNHPVINRLQEHVARGDTVYIVSASLPEWIEPWCSQLGVNAVLATEIQVNSEGLITGRFKTRNCYGAEKVARLLQVEPNRWQYILHAYGDSAGDKEMIAFADEGTLITGQPLPPLRDDGLSNE